MKQAETLRTETSIGQRLSQQHLRFVRMLELNASELDEAVSREVQENPALAADADQDDVTDVSVAGEQAETHRGAYPTLRRGRDEDMPEIIAPAGEESLYDYLIRQLHERDLSPDIMRAAEYIAGSLDSNGYLRRSPSQLRDDMLFSGGMEISESDVEAAAEAIRGLDPAGIGASDLRECMLLQLKRMHRTESVDDAIAIVDTQFDALSKKHTHRIISALGIGEARVKQALNLIVSLNPKPGSGIGAADPSNAIVPDVVVDIDDSGRISLRLNNRIPELSVDITFAQAARELKAARRGRGREADFTLSRVRDARDFIGMLRQRQQTLLDVVTAIVDLQSDYFHTRDVYRLRPMIIKDISELTGYDISVVSRATANKYIETPWGTFALRFFFSDTIGDEEGARVLTNRKIEAEIARIVKGENKRRPLSDEKICAIMTESGYDVARRTVAKYRERLGIPVARLRKEL